MKNAKFLTFDPIQLKEFGMNYYEDGFSIRYKQYRRFGLLNGLYIPNGPVSNSRDDLENFFEYLKSRRFTKIKIDLPLLIADGLEEYIHFSLNSLGFTPSKYLQDNETILISKSNEKINNKEVRYYERKALDKYDFQIIECPNGSELERIYKVYADSASFQGYIPKNIATFIAMSPNSYVGVGVNKETRLIDGFVWGFSYELANDIDCKSYSKFLNTVFIGTNHEARKSYVGYGMHKKLFEYAFETLQVDFINFEGASRNQDRKYISFKKSFGGEFQLLGGSFEKTIWI